ncbi:MAG: hypothetical protein V1827_06535 [Candidatus Micrarchaeota archaeon]
MSIFDRSRKEAAEKSKPPRLRIPSDAMAAPEPSSKPPGQKDPSGAVAAPVAKDTTPQAAETKAAPSAPPAGREDANAYQKELLERQAFEKAEHIVLADTVLRIRLGRLVTSDIIFREAGGSDHEMDCVWGLGRDTGLKAVGSGAKETPDDLFRTQIVSARKRLSELSLALNKGPYADLEGEMGEDGAYAKKGEMAIKKLAGQIFSGLKTNDLRGHIDRVIDMRPSSSDMEVEHFNPRNTTHDIGFSLSNDTLIQDELQTAGAIMKPERAFMDTLAGSLTHVLVHPMEPYILAVSLLRMRGFAAYPAMAMLDGEKNPLIAVFGSTKTDPLITTFTMGRHHPPAKAIDIMSDVAMMGALHGMRAEMRVRHLIDFIQESHKSGRAFDEEVFENQLERIARSLFESSKRWDGKDNEFIQVTLAALKLKMVEFLLEIDAVEYAGPDHACPCIGQGEGGFVYSAMLKKDENAPGDLLFKWTSPIAPVLGEDGYHYARQFESISQGHLNTLNVLYSTMYAKAKREKPIDEKAG